eukprot:gene38748-59784_t
MHAVHVTPMNPRPCRTAAIHMMDSQVLHLLHSMTGRSRVKICPLVGGMPSETLKGWFLPQSPSHIDAIVATPGEMTKLLCRRKACPSLSNVRYVAVDEVDEIVDHAPAALRS